MAKLTIEGYEDGTLRYDVTQYYIHDRSHRFMDEGHLMLAPEESAVSRRITLDVTSIMYGGVTIEAVFNGNKWDFHVTRTGSTHSHWETMRNDNQLVVMLPAEYHIRARAA